MANYPIFFDFIIEFIKGESNSLHDFLTREFLEASQIKMASKLTSKADYAKNPPQSQRINPKLPQYLKNTYFKF